MPVCLRVSVVCEQVGRGGRGEYMCVMKTGREKYLISPRHRCWVRGPQLSQTVILTHERSAWHPHKHTYKHTCTKSLLSTQTQTYAGIWALWKTPKETIKAVKKERAQTESPEGLKWGGRWVGRFVRLSSTGRPALQSTPAGEGLIHTEIYSHAGFCPLGCPRFEKRYVPVWSLTLFHCQKTVFAWQKCVHSIWYQKSSHIKPWNTNWITDIWKMFLPLRKYWFSLQYYF